MNRGNGYVVTWKTTGKFKRKKSEWKYDAVCVDTYTGTTRSVAGLESRMGATEHCLAKLFEAIKECEKK